MRCRAWLAAIVMIVGCGPDAGGSSDSSSSASDGGSSEASSSGTTAADTSTGAPSCFQYDPAPNDNPTVAISVHHDGTTPVFFMPHGCAGVIVVDVRRDDASLPWLLDEECTPNTCDGFVAASDCSVGCNDCAAPNAGRIEAGVIGQSAWTGIVLTELPLDPACGPGAPDCPATCNRPDPAEAGTYELALTVYRTCTGTCECDTAGSAICGLFSGEQLSDPVTFTAMIDYPAQTSATITITD
jgi:hypothetical protein